MALDTDVHIARQAKTMPGLPSSPQAERMDIDDQGNLIGLTE